VVERLPANAGVGVADAAEPVLLLLEEVRVDRAEADPLVGGEAIELVPVVRLIPRDVDGHARTGAGKTVHQSRVRDALVDGACGAGPREDAEARTRVAVAPRGRLDLEPAQLRERRLDVDAAVAKRVERTHARQSEGMLLQVHVWLRTIFRSKLPVFR
jgi:hypothetical protein